LFHVQKEACRMDRINPDSILILVAPKGSGKTSFFNLIDTSIMHIIDTDDIANKLGYHSFPDELPEYKYLHADSKSVSCCSGNSKMFNYHVESNPKFDIGKMEYHYVSKLSNLVDWDDNDDEYFNQFKDVAEGTLRYLSSVECHIVMTNNLKLATYIINHDYYDFRFHLNVYLPTCQIISKNLSYRGENSMTIDLVIHNYLTMLPTIRQLGDDCYVHYSLFDTFKWMLFWLYDHSVKLIGSYGLCACQSTYVYLLPMKGRQLMLREYGLLHEVVDNKIMPIEIHMMGIARTHQHSIIKRKFLKDYFRVVDVVNGTNDKDKSNGFSRDHYSAEYDDSDDEDFGEEDLEDIH